MTGTFTVPVSFTNADGSARYEDVEVVADDVMSIRLAGRYRLAGCEDGVGVLVTMRDGKTYFVERSRMALNEVARRFLVATNEKVT